MKKLLIMICMTILLIPLFGESALVFADPSVDDTINKEENPEPAQEPSDNSSQFVVQEEGSLFLDFLKMLVALVFVLALIYFLLRFLQKRNRIYQQSRSLENVGGVGLGANKSVQVVRVGQKYFLIGVGEDVQLISEIDDPETIEQLIAQNDQPPVTKSFQSILKNFQNKSNSYHDQETKRQFETELSSMKNARERWLKRYRNRDEDHHE